MSCALGISAIGIVYPIITRLMLNELIPNRQYRMIIVYGIILLIVYIIKMLLKYSVDYYGHMVGTDMQADMRRQLFKNLNSYHFLFMTIMKQDK